MQPTNRPHIDDPAPPQTRADRLPTGLMFAGMTAMISGVSVFVNGYGVRRFGDPTTYTTAKNLVAALILATSLACATRTRTPSATPAPAGSGLPPWQRRAAYVLVAIIGGSLPFVLFFEGLGRASSTDAAFIHKTLVVWVGCLAAWLLRERLEAHHLIAMACIICGYAIVAGGIDAPAAGTAELLVLAATLCWSVEVVAARYVLARGVGELALGTARMLGGVLVLSVWAVVRGEADALWSLSPTQWAWALLTGLFLAAYVATWNHALARAPAVDVTAVLAGGALVTALLNAGIRNVPLRPLGLALLASGAALTAVAAGRHRVEPALS